MKDENNPNLIPHKGCWKCGGMTLEDAIRTNRRQMEFLVNSSLLNKNKVKREVKRRLNILLKDIEYDFDKEELVKEKKNLELLMFSIQCLQLRQTLRINTISI